MIPLEHTVALSAWCTAVPFSDTRVSVTSYRGCREIFGVGIGGKLVPNVWNSVGKPNSNPSSSLPEVFPSSHQIFHSFPHWFIHSFILSFMYIFMCMYTCIYTCMHTCIYTCMHACIYACMCTHMAHMYVEAREQLRCYFLGVVHRCFCLFVCFLRQGLSLAWTLPSSLL